jgi:hypothetical protein
MVSSAASWENYFIPYALRLACAFTSDLHIPRDLAFQIFSALLINCYPYFTAEPTYMLIGAFSLCTE